MMPETSILWSLPGNGLRGDDRSRIPLLSVLTELIVGQGLEPRKNKRLLASKCSAAASPTPTRLQE